MYCEIKHLPTPCFEPNIPNFQAVALTSRDKFEKKEISLGFSLNENTLGIILSFEGHFVQS